MNQVAGHEAGHADSHGSARVGFSVFVILAIFSVVEFAVAKEVDAKMVPLIAIALVKSSLILWYFMHVAMSWRSHRRAE